MTARDPIKLGTAYAGLQPWEHGGVSLKNILCRKVSRGPVIKLQ